MAKDTVRYPDKVVDEIDALVEDGVFESKSEFYRFASDFLLSVIDADHEPTVLGYGDIVADLESTTDGRLVPRAEGEEPATGPFLDAYIQVRRHLLYDDVEAARAVDRGLVGAFAPPALARAFVVSALAFVPFEAVKMAAAVGVVRSDAATAE